MDVLHDLNHALRTLRRRPGFAAVAVLSLGLGIGGSTALFAAAWAGLGRPLPFPDESRLVRLYQLRDGSATRFSLRPATYEGIVRRARSFEASVAHRFTDLTLEAGEAPERVVGIAVSEGWTRTLGVRPILGRAFTPEEYAHGEEAPVAVVSHAFWRDRLGAAAAALGTSIRTDGRVRTIVGVMPVGFRYPYSADLWLPMRVEAGAQRTWGFNAQARLRPGLGLDAANAELRTIADVLAAEAPEGHRNATLAAVPLRETLLGEASRSLVALFAATGFLALIVCANLANLLLARGFGRRRELALRAALGAGRLQRARLVMAESVVIAVAGGALGAWLAWAALAGLEALLPDALLTAAGGPTLDAPVLAWVVLASLVSAVALGLAPAVAAARVDLREALAGAARSGASHTSRWLDGFAVAQVGLCLVLLSGAALMARNLARLQGADLGYSPEGLHLFSAALDAPSDTAQRRVAFVAAVEERLRGLPGVSDAGATNLFPLADGTTSTRVVGGDTGVGDPLTVNLRLVTPGFFRALGLAPTRGRLFGEADAAGGARVAILAESLAERLFPGREAIGRRLVNPRAEADVALTVVGVVPDLREGDGGGPTLYLAHAQEADMAFAGRATFVVRARAPLGEAELRRAMAGVDPTVALYDAQAASVLYRETLAPERLGTGLVSAFAGFGLLLCLLGVYGVLAAGVAARRREIAVRLALGAAPLRVLRGVLARGAALLALGSGLGLLGSVARRRVAAGLVREVSPGDPIASLSALALLALAGLAAAAGPALSALRTDPAQVLRSE